MSDLVRPTKIPGFTTQLPSKVDPAVRAQLNALAEAIDIRLGRRGHPLDRAPTVRELIAAGVLVSAPGGRFRIDDPYSGGISSPLPVPVLSAPPTPTGVSATGGFSLVSVFWDFPIYSNHAYSEIWRHTADVLGDATLVGVSGGRSYVDSVGEGADYYYWVRHISQANVPGPWHATAGEHATTAPDLTVLMDILTITGAPFFVQSIPTTINGVAVPAGTYMRDAFIANGIIDNAKIGDLAVDDAKIASLSVDKVTAGSLSVSFLDIDGVTLVASGDTLVLGSVYAANMTVDSIITEHITGAAVQDVTMSEVFTSNALPTDASYENVDTLTVIKEIDDSIMVIDFQLEATCTGSGNYALYVYIKVDGTIYSRLFSYYMTKSFAETVQGKVIISGLPAATNDYQLAVQANVSGAGVSTCTINSSTLIVTEVKR